MTPILKAISLLVIGGMILISLPDCQKGFAAFIIIAVVVSYLIFDPPAPGNTAT